MHALSHLPRTFHPYSHWLKFEPCPDFTHDHHHGHPRERCLFTLISALYFLVLLPSLFLHLFFFIKKKFMANLYNSAEEGVDTTDVLFFPTGYEPKAHDIYELLNSPAPLSYMTPTADQDYDDSTLEEMLYRAHRAQVDHSVREDSTHEKTHLTKFGQNTQTPFLTKFSQNTKHQFSPHAVWPNVVWPIQHDQTSTHTPQKPTPTHFKNQHPHRHQTPTDTNHTYTHTDTRANPPTPNQ